MCTGCFLLLCVCCVSGRVRAGWALLLAGAQGALRSAAGAEDPRVRRTDPMCVWHSLGVINVFVRPPSLHSRLTPPRRAPSCCCCCCCLQERAANLQEKINKFREKNRFVGLIDWLIGAVIGWFDLDWVNWANWGWKRWFSSPGGNCEGAWTLEEIKLSWKWL